MSEQLDIPQEVIEALADVRETGAVNMFDRLGVVILCGAFGKASVYSWLSGNPDRYMDALNAMGKYVTERDAR